MICEIVINFKGSGCRTFGIMDPINLLPYYEAQSKHHNSSPITYVMDTFLRPASREVPETTILTEFFTYWNNPSYISIGTKLLLHPSKTVMLGTCTPLHAPGYFQLFPFLGWNTLRSKRAKRIARCLITCFSVGKRVIRWQE